MFNKKCGEIISFMPILFVKQSLLFFNSSRCYCSFYWELVLFEYVQQAKKNREFDYSVIV
jgi:hypothetical protein